MLSMIGSVSVIVALLAAIVVSFAGIVGGFRRSQALTNVARWGSYLMFAAMTVAFIAMEIALLTHDFSVEYVARVGSRETPTYYTAISLWSSLDGSILFWGWILAAYQALVAFVQRDSESVLTPFALGVMGVVSIFFFGLLVGPASPFGLVSPAPANGPGPNPLLQNHPLMGLHPPMLYFGYVGLTVPFGQAGRGVDPDHAALDRRAVGVPLGRDHRRRLVVLRGARVGRLLGLGPGGERVVPALAHGDGLSALGDGAGAARDA